MKTLRDLFDFILSKQVTVVYGNLSRHPHVLMEYLTNSRMMVTVRSPKFPFPEGKNVRVNTLTGKCDLMVVVEPEFGATILAGSNRTVVFTSHLLFTVREEASYVVFYEGDPLTDAAERLMARQGNSVQYRTVGFIQENTDFREVKTLARTTTADYPVLLHQPPPAFAESTYVIADLSHVSTAFEAFIDIQILFDVLKLNVDKVHQWLICFPPGLLELYEAKVQLHVDTLYCKTFVTGNLLDRATLIKATPFHTHTSDRFVENPTVHRFSGFVVYNPASVKEWYDMNLKYNMECFEGLLVPSVH